MDVAGTSAAFIMTAPIANELGLDVANSIWVVYSYSVPFASLLLFAGRVTDLYVSRGTESPRSRAMAHPRTHVCWR